MSTKARLPVLVLLAALIAGCSSNTVDPDNIPGPQFLLRTSPDNVLENIELSYEEMMAEEYLDCLSEDFVFYPTEEDVNDPGNPIPGEWHKAEETTIHESMFSEGSNVEEITLTLTVSNTQFVEGNPADDADDVWIYTVDVDLRVRLAGYFTMLATSPSEFHMRFDTDQTGPGGQALWEIYRWYDLGDGREDSSWGSIKAMYL